MKGYEKITFTEMIEMGKIPSSEDVNDVRSVSSSALNFRAENGP